MKIFSTIKEIKHWRGQSNQETISLVPTMGSLHSAHGYLIEQAQAQSDVTVVYIFANPLQFGKNEDFDNYPTNQPGSLEKDLEFCKQKNVDIVFAPSLEEIYPNGIENITKVKPNPKLANCLCGLSRPGHFAGVLTVLLKFFSFIQPHKAFFGEKDYQQFLLVKQMVQDFNLNLEIIPIPIKRESSGLALSSRNQYLSDEQKQKSAEIYATLQKAAALIQNGKDIDEILKSLSKNYFEYFEARNNINLEKTKERPLRLFVAAKIGKARLIDNLFVE